MPWFPDFVNAVELARRETRAAGQADAVREYLMALERGDSESLEAMWPGELIVHDPRAGEVSGSERLRGFVEQNRVWLAEHHARTTTVATTSADRRAVVELIARMDFDGHEVAWPVAVVADSPDETSVVFRTYCSQVPVDGRHHLRPPVLEPRSASRSDDVVGTYLTALAAGDTASVVSTFVPDGYLREPIGDHALHRGTEELRSFFTRCFGSGGGIVLEQCATTDDGVRCALEYNWLRWGSHDLPPQAGLGVWERTPDGRLAAVRLYDDVALPG